MGIKVYILECCDGSYYVGCTANLDQRLKYHDRGKASKWTAERAPVKLVYNEEHENLINARRREKQIKSWSRIKKERLISSEWTKQ